MRAFCGVPGLEGEPTFTRETNSMRERPRTRRISVCGIQADLIWGYVPVTGKYCCPLPAGFPQNRSPLKGNPPFWGKPSALGHEGYRGRRLCGAAMLCRLQCARFAKRMAHCRRTLRLALGTHFVAADLQEGYALCKFG